MKHAIVLDTRPSASDFEIRTKALSQAILLHRDLTIELSVVETAAIFEKFLRGEAPRPTN